MSLSSSRPTTTWADGLRRLAIMGGPLARTLAGRRGVPLYGVLHHVGRKSGRRYATPVVVRAHEDLLYVPLPFGERTDWYRNAVAVGRVRLTWKGDERWLADPAVIDLGTAAPGFSGWMRAIMRAVGIERVVCFRLAPARAHED